MSWKAHFKIKNPCPEKQSIASCPELYLVIDQSGSMIPVIVILS